MYSPGRDVWGEWNLKDESETMNWQAVLTETNLSQDEIEAVNQVIASGWLSMGTRTREFEREFSDMLGVEEAVYVSSGTAALHIAAQILDLKAGDEIIVPSLTFVASVSMMVLNGAKPVFAEVKGPRDLTLDPDDVAKRITSRTKAVVVVHYGGYPADMEAIKALASQHDLFVIEDTAHAPVVQTPSGNLGTLGDVGCFSFFATKNITTGEGGMLLAKDPDLSERARALRSHCMTTSSWDKHQGRSSLYDVLGLGFNYRPTELGAAIGRVQLEKLADDRRCRRVLAREYIKALQSVPGIEMPFSDWTHDSAHHLMPILLPRDVSRPMFQKSLRERGIQTSVHYPPIHLFTYYAREYGYRTGMLPVTEDIGKREVSLPLYAGLDIDRVNWISDAVKEAISLQRSK